MCKTGLAADALILPEDTENCHEIIRRIGAQYVSEGGKKLVPTLHFVGLAISRSRLNNADIVCP